MSTLSIQLCMEYNRLNGMHVDTVDTIKKILTILTFEQVVIG